MLSNNFAAFMVTFALALLWLRWNNFLTQRGWMSSFISRKIIHIGTGPIFVLCWLLFTDGPSARYLAMGVPLIISLQFALVGLGVIKDPAAVASMSRSGIHSELLRGPLYYGIAFVALTILFWLDSPVGVIALMLLCGGDGLADIVGQRYGKKRLPWSKNKSWAGSLAMFLGGGVMALVVIALLVWAEAFPGGVMRYLPAVGLIAAAATLVESLPFKDIDNLTVPLVGVIFGQLLFR